MSGSSALLLVGLGGFVGSVDEAVREGLATVETVDGRFYRGGSRGA